MDFVPRLDTNGNSTPVTMADGYTKNNEFNLMRVYTKHYYTKYTCCPERWPAIEFSLSLKRASMTYVTGIVLPLVVVR